MKKKLKKEKNDDEKLSEKILDLCMWYQTEDSHRWIEIINHRIKFCDIKIQHLLDSKPLFFQKKKLEKFNKDLEELEQEKMNLYKEVGEEVNIIEKLQKSINDDETEKFRNFLGDSLSDKSKLEKNIRILQ